LTLCVEPYIDLQTDLKNFTALLTIYPGFVSLYETTHLPFEETWRNTCILLGAPLAKGPRESRIRDLLLPLEEAMDGKVELDKSGRFYLNIAGGRMEMHLVAEGLRKLAMIARLIATGSLLDKGFLFWDEPESNLNPKSIKQMARTILHLCRSGCQVFIASHSLFLMRELDILLRTDEFDGVKSSFIGLHRGEAGVDLRQGETIDDIARLMPCRRNSANRTGALQWERSK
jgi:AAA domain, putative AbiEii toxin, Type IV TA system